MNDFQITNHLQALNIKLLKIVMALYKDLGMDITPVQGRIIMAIAEGKTDFCQTDIKKFISCNKSTLSSILDTMEKNSLIVRCESSDDSRKKIIVLTDSSKEIVKKVKQNKDYVEMKLCEGISKEECIFFDDILKKMKDNLERIKV